MKKIFTLSLLPITLSVYGQEVDLASTNNYHMQYPFAPPPIITPQTDLNTPIENQFNYQPAWLDYTVAQQVSANTNRPFQFNTQFSQYSNLQRALLRHRASHYYVIAQAYRLQLEDYKDAKGNRINAGYTRNGQTLILGYLPSSLQEYRLGVIYDQIDKDKQPQHQMDAVKTKRLVFTGMLRLGEQDQSNTFNLNIRHVQLQRQANNFELRSNSPQVKMEVNRTVLQLETDYRYQYQDHLSQFGIKYHQDRHNAERFLVINQNALRNAYRFPNIHSKQWHIFYDHIWKINSQHTAKLGVSYDQLIADPRNRNINAIIGQQTFPTPNQIWAMHYGQQVQHKQKTQGLGALLQYQWQTNAIQQYTLELSSLIRHPHNAERYTALFGQNGAGWVGNPFLQPERHNQIKLNSQWQGEGWLDYGKIKGGDINQSWQVELQAYYDRVNHFITLDRARKQAGIVANNNNIISRNVDANLLGGELALAKNLSRNLATRAKLRYQYGQNRTDNRPLYNVRPLTLDLALDWQAYASFGSYNIGASLHYSHKSKRLDDNKNTGLGLDLPINFQSYAVFNIYTGIQFNNRIALNAGINNLFNRQYYSFNEQPHVAAFNLNPVAAPERTYWTALNFNF